ncbi:MAG: alternative ribosome rescue aminoacyl-tRNA hydrolase ArfB [Planctomycetota bacterium]
MSQPPKPEGALELGPGVWVDDGAIRYAFSRSGGPGGQVVNKLSTKAELRVAVESIRGLSPQAAARLRTLAGQRLTQGDELVLVASTTRSQLDNKRACLRRLRALVAEALDVPKPRKATRPSRAAVEKRLTEKRRTSGKKEARRPPEEDS